mgnify:CR=1 FL=1
MKMQKKERFASFMEFKAKHRRVIMILLLFFIIPVLSSLILGYEMKADVAMSIPTVVMDSDDSSFTRMFLDYVDDSAYFDIQKYAKSYDEVEDMLYKGKAYLGIIIPENFYSDVLEGKAPVILTVYDGSTLPVIVSSKTSMTEILMTVKSAYMMNVYEGKQNIPPAAVMNYVSPINNVTRILYNPTKSFRSFALPGLLCGIVQIAIAIGGAETGYAARRTGGHFRDHVRNIVLCALLGTVSVFMTMSVQWLLYGTPLRGTMVGFTVVTILFALDITSLGYIIGSVFPDRLFCTQLASVIVLPTSILAGYIFPVVAMPKAMQHFAHILPFTYFSDTVRNTCLKPLKMHHLYEEMTFLLCFFLCEMILLMLVKHWTMRSAEKEARA